MTTEQVMEQLIASAEKDIRGRIEGLVGTDLDELAELLDNEDDDLCRAIRGILDGFLG